MWRITPGEDFLIRRGTQNYTCIPSGGPVINGAIAPDVSMAVTGDVDIGGVVLYITETSAIGTVIISGTAIRADVATLTPVGECAAEGEAAREGESVIAPSGGMILSGNSVVQYAFHYGWWPSDGFWPYTYGFWWDAYYSYEQQSE